jgi:hypothetical protein
MKEVYSSDYLQKKAKKSLLACVAWAVVAIILLFAGIATGVTIILVSGVIAVMVALFVAVKRGPFYATYRCGIRGEQVLRVHLLSLGLCDEYTAYYNVPLNGKGRASDIDCVLVGPSGLFVFEAKHHHGLILYRNRIWARIKAGRRGALYRGQLGDPSGQLYRNIRKLKELLGHTDGLWLHGAIVFTNPRAVLDIEGLRWVKAIAVKDLEQILSNRTVLSADQVDRINARLAAFVKSNYGKMEIML